MSTLKIASSGSLSFIVNETKLVLDGNSGSVTIQAQIVNQEGYAHKMYDNKEIMTSEEIQKEKTKADLKAMARAAFFIGSFIPCPPLQIACVAGSVAMDVWDLKEHTQQAEYGYSLVDVGMIAVDAFAATRVLKAVRTMGRLEKAVEAANDVNQLKKLDKLNPNNIKGSIMNNFSGFVKNSAAVSKGKNEIRGALQSGEALAKTFAQNHPRLFEQFRKGRERVRNFPDNSSVGKLLMNEKREMIQNVKYSTVTAARTVNEIVKSRTGRAVEIGTGGVKVYMDHDEANRKEIEKKIEAMVDNK